MIIKVCGMREAENIREVEALRPDWMGFIFWPKSKRFVSERPEYMPKSAKRVGVFVDEDIETFKRIADDYSLDYIQLHGHESPDYIRQLKAVATPRPSRGGVAVGRGRVFIIKAFNIATAADLAQTADFDGLADYFLFDTKVAGPDHCLRPGGSGQQFDWSVLEAYDGDTPFLLSGGIGPDDVPALRAFFVTGSGSAAAKCIGIDLNSRFEIAPGLKDINKLREFIKSIRQ